MAAESAPASSARELARHRADFVGGDAAAMRHHVHVDGGERLAQGLEVGRAFGHEGRIHEALARDDRRGQRQQQPDVRTGRRPHVSIGRAGGLGLTRVHDDQAPLGVLREGLEVVVRVVAAVRDTRVRAHHEQELRVRLIGVEEDRGRRVEHPVVDEEVLMLLLRECVEPALRPHRLEPRQRVGGIHVVGLPSDADESDGAGAVLAPKSSQLRPDLRHRLVPADPFEAPVGAPAQRMLEALIVMRIVGHRERLVAHVAVRHGMGLVRAHRRDAPVLHIHPQAAVVAAQHADRREVARRERERGARDRGRHAAGRDGGGGGHRVLLRGARRRSV
jgi:hypothetical protein